MAFITLPDGDDHVFVFGSNTMGIHGAGAARQARDEYGAVLGQGIGHFGRSYALPTVGSGFHALSLDQVQQHVRTFLDYARERSDLTFWLTPVGCGIAGFTPEQIAPLFAEAPANVRLPVEFTAVLGRA